MAMRHLDSLTSPVREGRLRASLARVRFTLAPAL